ncbi:MAG: molecular chaperone TorD family protein [Acidobacteria bacterium]|nr:molecular chaperone TorD family protein [Acidobacteriota bacterium]
MIPGDREELRDIALCRSLLYQAVSLGFLPPTELTIERLGRESSAAALAEAAAYLDDQDGTALAPRTRTLAAPVDALDSQALTTSSMNLFGHTARGPVPPYETEYGEDEIFQKPHQMSDVAGIMGAFGLKLDPSAHERIDHIACELELAAFLARKEAHAVEIGDAAMLEQTRKAMRLLLRDHLGRFVPSFAGRLRHADPQGFYGALAELCRELVEADCRRYDAPLGSESLRLKIPIHDNAPMACGSAAGCPASCDSEEMTVREEAAE